MSTRTAHLVGSLPGATPAAAMTQAVEILGPHLRSLPDGETGERRNWIISIIEGLRQQPDLEATKPGDWSDYDKTPRMRVKRGHRLYGASLDFGRVDAVRDSLPAFERVCADAGLPRLDFQEGVPGDFDLAVFTLGPAAALRHRRAFAEASLADIRDVKALAGPGTLFQIEVPVELVMLAKAPAAARPLLAKRLARTVTGFAAGAAEGTRFAVHLCFGDTTNRAFGTMTDVRPLVLLATPAWPGGRPSVPTRSSTPPSPPTTTYHSVVSASRPGPLRRRLRPRGAVAGRPAPHPPAHRGQPPPPGRHLSRLRPRTTVAVSCCSTRPRSSGTIKLVMGSTRSRS